MLSVLLEALEQLPEIFADPSGHHCLCHGGYQWLALGKASR